MRYKLLVLDLDGTLTNSKKEITPYTKEVLIKAQEQGLHLVLASGRPTYGIVPLAETLEMGRFGGFILSFNGGKVIEVKTDTILYAQALPPDVMPLLYQRSHEAGLTILSYNGKYILTENAEDKYVQYESFLTKMKVKETDNFLRDLQLPADKCLIVGEPEDLVPLEEKLRQELGSRINVYRSEAFYLEVVPKGIDKAASLERLLERIHIKQEEIIAMGDGFNDLTMIRFAGLGVAMANAQPPVKANADKVTPFTNDEDGVAHFIEDLMNA
ncbi:Cof-type HAD-IIB family hydrolase [Parabacteroides sp.]